MDHEDRIGRQLETQQSIYEEPWKDHRHSQR